MKKQTQLIIALAVLAGAGWISFFWWNNLRGVGPALKPPSGDIASQIETVPKPIETGSSTTAFGMAEVNGMPLKLPQGFSVTIFAKQLGGPRVLLADPLGNLLASVPSKGNVVALPDKDSNGVADSVVTLLSGLNKPHGLAFRTDGGRTQLYVAEGDGVSVFDYDAEQLKATNKKKIIDLPDNGGHWTRTLLFHDGKLLIAVGSSCNVCIEKDWQRAKILVANPDGSDLKEYAKGLRNSVFMVKNPDTKKVWATEMGRDLLGDDVPPDEINIIEEGKNYGWPNCYGKNIHDDAFDKNTYIRNPCMEPFETQSHIDLQAHSAPLGLAFIPESWPQEYRGDLLVGFHGSWNRTVPTGYSVVRLKLDTNGNFQSQEDFISGWIKGNQALGRPVDVMFKDKDLYISDDKAGVIYRVTPP